MRSIYFIVEGIATALLALFFVTQVVVPALRGGKFFPLFRKEQKIINQINEAKQQIHEKQLEEQLDDLQEKLKREPKQDE